MSHAGLELMTAVPQRKIDDKRRKATNYISFNCQSIVLGPHILIKRTWRKKPGKGPATGQRLNV